MKFTTRHELDADSDTVIKMFTDPDYFMHKYEAQGATDIAMVDQSSNGDTFSITVRRTEKVSIQVPSFAKKFVGETTVVTQTDTWNAATKSGNLNIELQGAPADINATMQLSDAGGKTINTIDWNIKVSVPLAGGKLEKLIGEDIQSKTASDDAISAKLLADYI